MALYGNTPSKTASQGGSRVPVDKVYGLGWPIGGNPKDPYFSKASTDTLVRSQIKQILLTNKGERVMLPEFGISLHSYLFEPLTGDIANVLAYRIKTAVAAYAPNIELLRVVTRQEENLKGYGMPGLIVNLTVRNKASNNILDINVTT